MPVDSETTIVTSLNLEDMPAQFFERARYTTSESNFIGTLLGSCSSKSSKDNHDTIDNATRDDEESINNKLGDEIDAQYQHQPHHNCGSTSIHSTRQDVFPPF
jgi:hypothetical protein